MKRMKKIITILFILVIAALIVGQGCVEKPEGTGKTEKEAPPGATDEQIKDVGQGISEIGDLDKELNITDLEDLDQDLDEINW